MECQEIDKERKENETENETMTLTAEHGNGKIRDYYTVDSPEE